jgi:hypothetical protein
MAKGATLYDICAPVFRGEKALSEPGRNLHLAYRRVAGHPLLKHLILRGCRRADIGSSELLRLQAMMRAALHASGEDWRSPSWIESTFQPLARLLDRVESPRWQVRELARRAEANPPERELRALLDRCLKDAFRVWRRDRKDPWFPVAAQVVLSGDDHMDGESLLEILRGVGSFEYQNITVLFALIRCLIMAAPGRLRLLRRPYRGVSEPMSGSIAWIWHRIAFSDVNFFEHLLVLLELEGPGGRNVPRLLPVLENLLRYCLVTSREWLVTPNRGIRHPAITCLPKDDAGRPLCRLNGYAWQVKRQLGFGDYVPDTDTTFLTLAMARKWLDLVERWKLPADPVLLSECQRLLDHPWVEIIAEYQVGGPCASNPPTIHITKPLDYEGSVPIWFDKPFRKADGRVIRETLGNEICPGHNMDILDSILLNRVQWRALVGENLDFLHRLLEFHHRAFSSGNFRRETALKYYLPEIYTYYLGRMYQTWCTLSPFEQQVLDPAGKIQSMRRIAIGYCAGELLGGTLNAFDAALAVSALVLLGYEPKDDGLIATGLRILSEAAGEGRGGHPFRGYEWNRMRHPTRILVGSPVSTSLFVLRACVESLRYLYGVRPAGLEACSPWPRILSRTAGASRVNTGSARSRGRVSK